MPTWEEQGGGTAVVTSGAGGAFRFDKLYAGGTDLWAEHETLGVAWLADVRTDGGEPLELRLRSRPESARYAGVLLDAADRPVAAALVVLVGGPFTRAVEVARTTTGGDGRFTVVAADLAPRQRTGLKLVAFARPGSLAWRALPYAEVDGLTLRLGEQATLAGRVLNQRGEPVAGATARLSWLSHRDYGELLLGEALSPHVGSAQSDADGGFLLPAPAGASVAVAAERPDYGPGSTWRVSPEGPAAEPVEVQLKDGITLEGTVRFPDGTPAAGAVGKLGAPELSQRSTTTGDDGGYRFTGLSRDLFQPAAFITAHTAEDEPRWSAGWIGGRLHDGEGGRADLVLEPSLAGRQAEWLADVGEPAESDWLVAVLEGVSVDRQGREHGTGTLRVLGSRGEELGRHVGLRTHAGQQQAMAWSPADGTLWVSDTRENVLLAFDQRARLRARHEGLSPSAIISDLVTGNLWALASRDRARSLLVINRDGRVIREQQTAGMALTYSPHDESFWVVGSMRHERLGGGGATLFATPREYHWDGMDVAADTRDGSVWILERPGVPGERHLDPRLLVLNMDGSERRQIALDDQMVRAIAVDGTRGVVWAACYGSPWLLQLSMEGQVLRRLPVQASSLAVEPDTGYLWAAGPDGVFRIDTDGKPVWHEATPDGQDKTVCVLGH